MPDDIMDNIPSHHISPDQEPLLTPSPTEHDSPLLADITFASSSKSANEPSRPLHRTSASHKNHHPHGHNHIYTPGHTHARHAVKSHLGTRNLSHSKNLHKLSLANQHTAAQVEMAPSTSAVSQRPSAARQNSKTLLSPTTASPQNRPAAVKRNASGFVVPRTSTHSALKKNHSDRHLPRHGSSKNVNKAGRPSAPMMRRTQSSKSNNSEKSNKSQKSTGDRHGQPTVRFDLGDEESAQTNESENNGEDGDEWTDSTSLSPNTTRDHTRNNSVILGNPLNGSPLRSQTSNTPSGLNQETVLQPSPKPEEEALNPPAIRRNASNISVLTPDAITSRLLMRAPSAQTLSTVNATAVGTPSYASLSHSQTSILGEGVSSGSGGTNLVSRFLAGGNSHGATSELLSRAIMSRNAPVAEDSDSDEQSRKVDAHRRNKSTSNVSAMKSTTRNAPPKVLPPSRTSQKLELQRASTMAEPSRKVPIMPSRPTAPALLSTVNNNFGLGGGEGAPSAPTQSLFAQIDKDYEVIRRFRRPVQEAIGRLVARESLVESNQKSDVHKKGKAPAAAPAPQTKQPPATLKVSKNAARDLAPEIKSPEHLNARRSRVSFEIPSSRAAEASALGGDRAMSSRKAEISELCRRMWDLSAVAEPVTHD